MQADESESNENITAQFLKQYYSDIGSVPHEILVEKEPPERELIQEYLSGVAGRAVKITVPKKGDKKALLDLARCFGNGKDDR